MAYRRRSSRAYARSPRRYRRSYRRSSRAAPTVRVIAARPSSSKAVVPTGLQSVSKTIRKIPFLMAQIDPFLPSVRGVKVPDANTMESGTVQIQDEYTCNTVATEVNGWLFNPAITSFAVPGTSAPGAWTWPITYGGGSDCATKAQFQAAYTATRCVAHAIRLSCLLAPTTVTGFVHVAVYAPATFSATTWPFPTTIAAMRDLPHYRKVTLASLTQNPLTIVNKFLDQTAFRYIDSMETNGGYNQSNRNSFQVTHSWASIIVAIEGAPTASSLGVEVIQHHETLARAGTSNGSSPAAPPQQTVMTAAANIAADAPATHFESEQGSVLQQAADAVQAGARAGAENVLNAALPHLSRMGENAVYVGTAALLNYGAQRLGGGGMPGVNNQNRLT